MSVTLSDVTTLVRYLIGDNTTTGKDIFTYGSSKIFTLSESNVASVTDVYINDAISGVSHSYNSTTNKVTIASNLVAGDTIEIDYSYYPNYSDTEINNYVQATISYLSINNYYTFEVESSTIYPEPTTKEKHLIAMITAIKLQPNNISYSLPDISIRVPSDLPTEDKIRKTIAIFKKDSHGIFDIMD